MFRIPVWGAWSFVWGLSPPNPPVATGLIATKQPKKEKQNVRVVSLLEKFLRRL